METPDRNCAPTFEAPLLTPTVPVSRKVPLVLRFTLSAAVHVLITGGNITSRTLSVEEWAKGNRYWHIVVVVWVLPPSASAPWTLLMLALLKARYLS